MPGLKPGEHRDGRAGDRPSVDTALRAGRAPARQPHRAHRAVPGVQHQWRAGHRALPRLRQARRVRAAPARCRYGRCSVSATPSTITTASSHHANPLALVTRQRESGGQRGGSGGRYAGGLACRPAQGAWHRHRPAESRQDMLVTHRVRSGVRSGWVTLMARAMPGRRLRRLGAIGIRNPDPHSGSGSSGCASEGVCARLLVIFWARRVMRAASCPSLPRSSRAMNQVVPWRALVAST